MPWPRPRSLDELSNDEIDAWLVTDKDGPATERPSGVYTGDTMTFNSYKESGSKSDHKIKAQPPESKPAEVERRPRSRRPRRGGGRGRRGGRVDGRGRRRRASGGRGRRGDEREEEEVEEEAEAVDDDDIVYDKLDGRATRRGRAADRGAYRRVQPLPRRQEAAGGRRPAACGRRRSRRPGLQHRPPRTSSAR